MPNCWVTYTVNSAPTWYPHPGLFLKVNCAVCYLPVLMLSNGAVEVSIVDLLTESIKSKYPTFDIKFYGRTFELENNFCRHKNREVGADQRILGFEWKILHI